MTNWQGVVDRTVTGMGYELVDAEKSVGGLLRVFIDHPAAASSAVSVDDCERVTRQLQHVLEVEGCAYERLEVSSPGLDRPLKKAADYARFEGEQVELTLKEPFQGRKRFRGALRSNGDAWRLVLTPQAVPPATAKKAAKAGAAAADAEQALDFSLDEVREAHLVPVVDFKGRRHAAPATSAAGSAPPAQAMDGGRIQ